MLGSVWPFKGTPVCWPFRTKLYFSGEKFQKRTQINLTSWTKSMRNAGMYAKWTWRKWCTKDVLMIWHIFGQVWNSVTTQNTITILFRHTFNCGVDIFILGKISWLQYGWLKKMDLFCHENWRNWHWGDSHPLFGSEQHIALERFYVRTSKVCWLDGHWKVGLRNNKICLNGYGFFH